MKTNEEYSYHQIIEEARRIMDKANHQRVSGLLQAMKQINQGMG
ncbi:hypothetical protein ACR9MC_05555 [Helicobacter pylori]